MRRYVLKKNNLYLCEILFYHNEIEFIQFDKELRLLYDDIEKVHYDKQMIKDELGLELNLEICKEVENEI